MTDRMRMEWYAHDGEWRSRGAERTFGAGCVGGEGGRFSLTHGNDAISGIPQLTYSN